jgi:hypothetical protein
MLYPDTIISPLDSLAHVKVFLAQIVVQIDVSAKGQELENTILPIC